MTRYLCWFLRRITFRPCREPFCNNRHRCARWHIEVWDCPTCGTEIDEMSPAFGAVIDAVLEAGKHPVVTRQPDPPTWWTTWDGVWTPGELNGP